METKANRRCTHLMLKASQNETVSLLYLVRQTISVASFVVEIH